MKVNCAVSGALSCCLTVLSVVLPGHAMALPNPPSADATNTSTDTRHRPRAVDKRVIGYFTQWGIYGRNYVVKDIQASGAAGYLTHINYAFGNVRNNRCEVGVIAPSDPNTGASGDAYADYTKAFSAEQSVDGVADTWNQPLRGNWNQLKKLKAANPRLKVLISLGGWSWSGGFSSAARPENRKAFVASCIDAYLSGNLPVTDGAGGTAAAAGVFDGIDIDWEYPVACGLTCGSPEDRENFTALLAEFRRQLDQVRPGLLLTVAVGASIDKIRVTDPGQYARFVDYINVMTYDFHGAWESRTNHHSALFGSPADPSTGDQRRYNSNDAMQALLDRGVPAAKLNLGLGFYGRGWTKVGNANPTAGCTRAAALRRERTRTAWRTTRCCAACPAPTLSIPWRVRTGSTTVPPSGATTPRHWWARRCATSRNAALAAPSSGSSAATTRASCCGPSARV